MFRLASIWLAVFGVLVPGVYGGEPRRFSAENGVSDIPLAPVRVVALNDQILAVPLYELGVTVFGSAGAVDGNGKPLFPPCSRGRRSERPPVLP